MGADIHIWLVELAFRVAPRLFEHPIAEQHRTSKPRAWPGLVVVALLLCGLAYIELGMSEMVDAFWALIRWPA